MAARKYEVATCPLNSDQITFCHEAEIAIAYDARDVDPLVEAARLALQVLDRSDGEPHAAGDLQEALAPFNSEEG